MAVPRDMDSFLPLLSTSDIKKKFVIGDQLVSYLGDFSNSIKCQDIGNFIDNIVPWLNNGSPKVVQNGLDILTILADRMEHDFKPYVATIIQPTLDRLGDSKEPTREKAHLALLKLMEKGCLTPQQFLEKLQPCFEHKNAKLREEAMNLLTSALNEHGADAMYVSGVMPSVAKLLADPTEKVRETAVHTLGEIYKHVGDRLRTDLEKRHIVPQAKWPLLIKKFDDLKASGCLLPTASKADDSKDSDEPDRVQVRSAPVKRTTGIPPRKGQFGPAKPASANSALPGKPSTTSSSISRATVQRSASARSASGQAGAVGEETFLAAFEDVPPVKLFSAKDLEERMRTIKETVGDDKKDWKQRIESMKKLRAIVLADGMSYDNFFECLKSLHRPFEQACSDLRSQVVREACITLAYLSQQLKNKFASFAETVLCTLMNLIQNSAKVVATAGSVAVQFILQNTHSPRLIPMITSTLSNKSKDIRRACCEYLHLILQSWSTQILQKHVITLQDAIKKGIADSDSDARAFARKSYWAFKGHFPEQAEVLLNSLDSSYKRSLIPLSNSGSTSSLNTVTRSSNAIPRPSRANLSTGGRTVLIRSASAVDTQAAKRVRARVMYANATRHKTPPQNDRAGQPNRQARINEVSESSSPASPDRHARVRTRVAGVSQSQPSSRSGSPSSRLNYATYNREGESSVPRPRRLSGHGIRSTSNSREPSPQRYGTYGSKIRGRTIHMSPTDRPPSRPVMAQKMLQQSREAESALADALNSDIFPKYTSTPRGKVDSDDSENSSICSERELSDNRRPSDSYSWSGSQPRLYRDLWDQPIPKDVKEIIENLGKKHWNDRREGLVELQRFLANGNTLSATELRKTTDIFAKMFMDSHTKVFSLFLDTLNELIATHNEDLGDWLYVLCARLLNKLGTDLLGSIQTKIHKTLDIVRDCFPGEQLLPAVVRFITDPTQTPNSRVKVATLTFLTQITESAPPSSLTNTAGSSVLARLLEWTNDVKSQDVRKHAQNAVMAMYNLNPPQVTMILGELPQHYQEVAFPLVQNNLRNSAGAASNPASPGTPPPRVPHSPARNRGRTEVDVTDDDLNPEEVYKSLRRTTAEIQNYGFERLERATTSKDSGISNMADVEERMEGLTMTNSGRSSSVSSPTQTIKTVRVNCSSDTIAGDLILPQENNGYDVASASNSIRSPEKLGNILSILESKESQSSEKVAALQDLQQYIREGDVLLIKQNFKKLLKTILLKCLPSGTRDVKVEVFQTLIDMIKCSELVENFSKFVELLVLKVLQNHKTDDQKGDSTTTTTRDSPLRMAEKCAATIATVLPPEQIVTLVSSIMTTETHPINVGAIKMLQKLVEQWGESVIRPHLGQVMPGLIQAYDDLDSSVRKSAVFCMVTIHSAVGEEAMKPYLGCLYGSKLKLLNIYIQRAEQQKANSKNNISTKT